MKFILIHPGIMDLILDSEDLEKSFEIHRKAWPKDNFPFSVKDSTNFYFCQGETDSTMES